MGRLWRDSEGSTPQTGRAVQNSSFPALPRATPRHRAVCRPVPPGTLRSLHRLQHFVGCSSHVSVACAHSWLNLKQTCGNKDLYVLEPFLWNIIEFTVSCSFLLGVSLNLALHKPSPPVPCFPSPQVQYLFKFQKCK